MIKIKKLDYSFSVCKVKDFSFVDFDADFFFVGKTDEEKSLVCITEKVPENVLEQEDGWKAFRIQGLLDFSLIGILSKLSGILADCGIGIFAVSTFNTDYILTKEEDFDKAVKALSDAGYIVE